MNRNIVVGAAFAFSVLVLVGWHYYDIATWEGAATVTLEDGTVHSGVLSWTSLSRDSYQIKTDKGVFVFSKDATRIIEIHRNDS